jgi:putative salt-induced outer membrane protein
MASRFLAGLLLLPVLAQAADETDSSNGVWSGNGTLGYTATSGNTDSKNLNAGLQLGYEISRWKHSLQVAVIWAETDGDKSADSKSARERTEYSLSEKSYAFGQARYEDDKFSGYDYQASIVAGFGSRFIDSETQLLDLSVGAGYRQSKESESGGTEDGIIGTSDLKYEYRFNENATFSETALVESGSDNTYMQSETALTTRIQGNLSAKISYLVKHNSDVPDGTDKTDKITSVSLMYEF